MGEGSWRRFTFHVDFMASTDGDAMVQAEAYAQGLIALRGEVDSHTARVSADGNWAVTAPVFCGAPGPDTTDMCVNPTDHPGKHHGPGYTREWADDEIPQPPDTLSDL